MSEKKQKTLMDLARELGEAEEPSQEAPLSSNVEDVFPPCIKCGERNIPMHPPGPVCDKCYQDPVPEHARKSVVITNGLAYFEGPWELNEILKKLHEKGLLHKLEV